MLKKVYMLFFIILLVSCQKEDTSISLNEDLNSKFVSAEELQEMRQKAGDIVYDESNMEQLMAYIDSLTTQRMNERGFKKIQPFDEHIQTRANVEQYSYIESRSGFDVVREVKGETWIKVKLFDELADKINEQYKNDQTIPKRQFERNKTYICTWRYVEPFVQLASNQYFAAQKSPKCGLKPSNRNQLLNCWRDYESYENSYKQVMMLTYALQIICLDTDGFTRRFEACYYPVQFENCIEDSKHGYIFNYSILTM